MPNFCYQVLDVFTDPDEPMTKIVRVVELPNQNLLEFRPLSNTRVIWLDLRVHEGENEGYRKKLEKEFSEIGFVYSDNVDEAIKQINQTVKTVLITAGSIGKIIVPKISHLQNVNRIIVFCMNLKAHQEWAREFPKVTSVTNNFGVALAEAKKALTSVMMNKPVPEKK